MIPSTFFPVHRDYRLYISSSNNSDIRTSNMNNHHEFPHSGSIEQQTNNQEQQVHQQQQQQRSSGRHQQQQQQQQLQLQRQHQAEDGECTTTRGAATSMMAIGSGLVPPFSSISNHDNAGASSMLEKQPAQQLHDGNDDMSLSFSSSSSLGSEDAFSEESFSMEEIKPLPIGPPECVNVVNNVPLCHTDQFLQEFHQLFVMSEQHKEQEQEKMFNRLSHNNNNHKLIAPTTSAASSSSATITALEPQAQHLVYEGGAAGGNVSAAAPSAAATITTSTAASSSASKEHADNLWIQRYMQLCEYKASHGHCLVPYSFEGNPSLGEWVKRQRYYYKLKLSNKETTMTDERIAALEKIGFVWSAHAASWSEKIQELRDFLNQFGHCNVPTVYPPNPKLANWVKRQRRQKKLYMMGQPSTMTPARLEELAAFGI